jgi:ribosomal-protein-alanine N-acetyltransferase
MMVDEAHILKLAVHPTFRRRRIGSVLVRFIIDEVFLVRGFDGKVIIEARVSNSPAIKLYESLGFKALYMRRRYYTEPEEDAVVMAFDSIKNTRT